MADKTVSSSFGDIKYHDNGDGTYAPIVYVGGGSSGGTSVPTTTGHGSRTVAVAGTDVPLSGSSVACSVVTIEAYRSNVGYIAVGGTGVDAAASGTGITLAAGDTVTLQVANLNAVYIDATVSGEGVRYAYGV